jgi:hypothetical protein
MLLINILFIPIFVYRILFINLKRKKWRQNQEQQHKVIIFVKWVFMTSVKKQLKEKLKGVIKLKPQVQNLL